MAPQFPFVRTSFVPEGEFDAIAYPDLVVDHAEIVSNNVRANPELLSNFVVLQPFCHKLYDPLLAATRLAILFSNRHFSRFAVHER